MTYNVFSGPLNPSQSIIASLMAIFQWALDWLIPILTILSFNVNALSSVMSIFNSSSTFIDQSPIKNHNQHLKQLPGNMLTVPIHQSN